jgi:hypothetical protein
VGTNKRLHATVGVILVVHGAESRVGTLSVRVVACTWTEATLLLRSRHGGGDLSTSCCNCCLYARKEGSRSRCSSASGGTGRRRAANSGYWGSTVAHLHLRLVVSGLTLKVCTVVATGHGWLPLKVLRTIATARLAGQISGSSSCHSCILGSKGLLRHGGPSHVKVGVWSLSKGGGSVCHVTLNHGRGAEVCIIVAVSSKAGGRTHASCAISSTVATTRVKHGCIIIEKDSRATELLSVKDILLLLAPADATLEAGLDR